MKAYTVRHRSICNAVIVLVLTKTLTFLHVRQRHYVAHVLMQVPAEQNYSDWGNKSRRSEKQQFDLMFLFNYSIFQTSTVYDWSSNLSFQPEPVSIKGMGELVVVGARHCERNDNFYEPFDSSTSKYIQVQPRTQMKKPGYRVRRWFKCWWTMTDKRAGGQKKKHQ